MLYPRSRQMSNSAPQGKDAAFSVCCCLHRRTAFMSPIDAFQVSSPFRGVAHGWFQGLASMLKVTALVLYAPCVSCGIISSSAAQHLDSKIASWSAVAGRPFCGRPEELPDSHPCASTGQLPHETASEGAVAARPRRLQPQQKAIPAQAAGHSGPVRAETVG